MSAARDRWADLAPRLASAVVMLAIGGWAIWSGGIIFAVFIALSCGGMMWELVRMLMPGRDALALQLGILACAAVLAAAFLPTALALPLLLAPALVGLLLVDRWQGYYAGFALWVLVAGFAFIWLRNAQGLPWLLWLISVVVATDVAGYFAGKALGGPKFWPRVSPKKTWSGTAGGWIAAAVVGALFAAPTGIGAGSILLSVLVSMASQAGDVAESALKRKMGVKDSSGLIPGHGGLFDRFDGMLGAAAMAVIASILIG